MHLLTVGKPVSGVFFYRAVKSELWVSENISLLFRSLFFPTGKKSSETYVLSGLPTAAVHTLENRAQVTSVPNHPGDEAISTVPYAPVGSG